MRLYLHLIDRTVSTEFPPRPGPARATVKAFALEDLEVRFHRAGTPELMPAGTEIQMVVRRSTVSVLLAWVTAWTSPANASGWYTGVLNLRNSAVQDYLAAYPDARTFPAEAELRWRLPGEEDWRASASVELVIQRALASGDIEDEPLVPPITGSAVEALAGEVLSSNCLVTLNDAGQWVRASGPGRLPTRGLVRPATSVGLTARLQTWGSANGFAGLVPGGELWLGANGQFTQSPPSSGIIQRVGVAVAADTILLEIGEPFETL